MTCLASHSKIRCGRSIQHKLRYQMKPRRSQQGTSGLEPPPSHTHGDSSCWEAVALGCERYEIHSRLEFWLAGPSYWFADQCIREFSPSKDFNSEEKAMIHIFVRLVVRTQIKNTAWTKPIKLNVILHIWWKYGRREPVAGICPLILINPEQRLTTQPQLSRCRIFPCHDRLRDFFTKNEGWVRVWWPHIPPYTYEE